MMQMPSIVTPPPITAEALAFILFGNPINPQDKGIIGTMQDQQKQLLLWFRLCFVTFLAGLLTAFADLITHFIK